MSSKPKTKKRRWKPMPGAALGPQEQKIMAALAKGAQPVWRLFGVITKKGDAKVTPRVAQQRVGAIVARLNKKLKGRRIVAGDVVRTYRLRRVR